MNNEKINTETTVSTCSIITISREIINSLTPFIYLNKHLKKKPALANSKYFFKLYKKSSVILTTKVTISEGTIL